VKYIFTNRPALTALLAFLSSPALSQEWIFGFGYADFSYGGSKDTAIVSAEYHSNPIRHANLLEIKWAGSVSVFATGDVHLGVGLAGTIPHKRGWFTEFSVLPGVYVNGEANNDLGSAFEIRSLISVGRKMKNGTNISVALTHKSNASTAENNPGVNSLVFRWHLPIRY
jgi:hypothetical protein